MEPRATRTISGAAPGSDRPTLALVAKRAGVSPSTASLAFSGTGPVSEKTRARVLAAAAELDYAGPDPTARSLRRGRSGVIGVVIEDNLATAFRDPVNLALLDGLGEGFGDEHLGLLVIPLLRDGADELAASTMDAAILLGCGTELRTSVDALRRRRIAVVAIEAEHMDGVIAIDLDNRAASRAGAEHLHGLGHRRVAVISLPLDAARSRQPLEQAAIEASTAYTALERLRGVREVYPDAGGIAAAASSVAEGLAAGRALLGGSESVRPTAIIAQSDLLAAGVLQAAEELGLRVPEELSVLGFDGIRLDGIAAQQLTTLVQPAAEKGRAAAAAVLAALAGDPPRPAALHCELRIGATTGTAPT